jgi:hypothetical protein
MITVLRRLDCQGAVVNDVLNAKLVNDVLNVVSYEIPCPLFAISFRLLMPSPNFSGQFIL